MVEITAKNRKVNTAKLLSFGFVEHNGYYRYSSSLVGGQMTLNIAISHDGKIHAEVIDNELMEEYRLHLVSDAVGSFVGQIKTEYAAILEEVFTKCFDVDVFKSEQAKEVIYYVRNKYGDELEFLWQKFPDNAVVRRIDNQKWYAAILTVSRRKLGFDSDEKVEILDLRMKSEDIQRLVDGEKYLPGYHMNKKHWVTICLDGTVSFDEICKRIDESYLLAVK